MKIVKDLGTMTERDDELKGNKEDISLRVANFDGVYDALSNKILTRISSLICHNYKNFYCGIEKFDLDMDRDNLKFLTIVIPVYGRKEHLKTCLQSIRLCLDMMVPQDRKQVRIVVSEMSSNPQHKDITKSFGPEFKYLSATSKLTFNKSLCMNLAAGFAPSEYYLFHDVDLVVTNDWLLTTIAQLLGLKNQNESDVMVQTIPQRKVLYVNEKDTNEVFSGQIPLSNIRDNLEYTTSQSYPEMLPPGGSVCMSADIFYAVQGFDPWLMWGYSPEDRFFMKNIVSMSGGKLSVLQDGPQVFHLSHPKEEIEGTKQNLSNEYMTFVEALLDEVPQFRAEYFALKHYYMPPLGNTFWYSNFPDRFPDLSRLFFNNSSGTKSENDIVNPPETTNVPLRKLMNGIATSRNKGIQAASTGPQYGANLDVLTAKPTPPTKWTL